MKRGLRVAVLVLGCAGCMATARDLPPGREFAENPALLAGRWRVTGTRIGSTILLQTRDERVLLRPDHPTFLPRGLVRLSPEPAEGSLVITVVPTWDSYTYPRYRYGFHYGGHSH